MTIAPSSPGLTQYTCANIRGHSNVSQRSLRLAASLLAAMLWCGEVWAQTPPRIPVNALPVAPTTERGANINYQVNGSTATITQTAATNIVRWNSFDIGAAAKVNIVQPSSSAVLLNKVVGGAYLGKTTIDGMLNANGRVYIYNANGVLFGKTAVVNVDTLIASSLKFDEARVIGGLLQPGQTPVLGADPAYLGVPGNVEVEGDASGQAQLTANTGGLILLAAPNVINNGLLNAPDGQVMLAAGSKVYLAAPNVGLTGTNLRGLLVEVSNNYAAGTAAPTATIGTSKAENGTSGQISVGRGNATMIGYAVNQMGMVSASTSVSLNGSIYLYARDQAVLPDANGAWQPSRTGKLVLGANSVTQILPTLNDTETVSATTTFNKSDVKLDGANIQLQQNARIVAPGGNVTITSRSLPNNPGLLNPDGSLRTLDPNRDLVRVDLAAGSLIDVSGSSGTILAMESNVITVDLRGTELADNTVLRDSPFYGTKVRVDVRKGTPIANISGWLNLVEYNLGQLNTTGGTVKISAEGAIIQRAGSNISVDGGWVDYQSGYVNTTRLKFGEKLVDIGSAKTNTLYSAALNLPNSPNNFELGYRQGSSAGTVNFSAPIVALQGGLSGQVAVGAKQRDVTAIGYPKGGQLQIGDVLNMMNPVTGKANISSQTTAQDFNKFVYTGNLQIGGIAAQPATAPEVDAPFDLTIADQQRLATSLDLDTTALALAGFSRISALTSANIDITAPVKLAPGGHLWLGAGQSLLLSNAGGDIQFNAGVTIPGGSVTAAASGMMQVADGTRFDLAGRWINDLKLTSPSVDANGNPLTLLVLKGGALNLSANRLLVGNNVSADVSAGAWLNSKAKTTQSSAGSITFEAIPLDSFAPLNASLQLGSALNLSGYGFSSGGTLKLVGRNVYISADFADADVSDLWLRPEFFQQGGFTSYDIAANVNFDMLANTVVNPFAAGWQFKPRFATLTSGAMTTVAAPYLYDLSGPARTRPATSVTFRALPQVLDNAGRLVINNGAKIELDPGASLSLYAGRQLTVNGRLNTPGGQITLGLTGSPGAIAFNAKRSIWFSPDARILSTGSLQRLYTNAEGISSGEVLDGGMIRVGLMQNGVLSAANGYVVAEAGSVFDVSGIAALGLRFKSFGAITPKQDVASSGGSIEIRALEGLLIEGDFRGFAGGVGARGGALTLALDRDALGPEGMLAILPSSTSIIPSGLQPDQDIVENVAGTGNLSGQNFWLLSGSRLGAAAKYVGAGWIPATSFTKGGFGRLTFKSQDVLAFGLGKSDLTLSARDGLILDAPNLRAFNNPANNSATTSTTNSYTLTLAGPYIQIGNTDLNYQLPGASSTGNAQLYVDQYATTTLDLIGNSALQGFDSAKLNAKGDIRLIGFDTVDADSQLTGYTQGSLAMTGNLTLTAAQTYPTTLNDFTFMVFGNGIAASSGTLTFATNGNAPQPVLSAGGGLVAIAPHIVQAGTVAAPFGSITLGNLDPTWSPSQVYGSLFDVAELGGLDNRSQNILTSDLLYKAGSVTTVAGFGVVPFGNVINGSVPAASDWRFGTTSISIKQNTASAGGLPVRQLPAKALVSNAQTIKTNSGSVQDMSGGGSLLAFEFTPGKGGSKDVLESKTTFAINPNYKAGVAPIDSSNGSSGLQAGDSVYLSGMPGLPAGIYTLLPAHYALLPGGYSITAATSTRDMQSSNNSVLADGSMLVAGRLTTSGSGAGSTRSNGFIVASGSVVSGKSEFAIYDATTYFSQQAAAAGTGAPELPVDGGYIAFNATATNASALALNGMINLHAAKGMVINPSQNDTVWSGDIKLATANGRAGIADIAAPQIAVVSGLNQGATGDAVVLTADFLNALGADQLLLGGLRSRINSSEQKITIAADTVTLSNDAQHPLSGSEIVIVANTSIEMEQGAVLQGSDAAARSPQTLKLAGGGALLRVSGGKLVEVVRAAKSTTGTLNIADGATVGASVSANLDATGGVNLLGQLNLPQGSALGLGSPGISLGAGIPASDTKLQLDTTQLLMLSGLSDLSLNSYASTINLYGTVNLGNAAMRSLAFQGTGFQGYAAGSDASMAEFIAASVRFTGTAATATPVTTLMPTGQLTVQADNLEIGNNAFAIHGFANTTLTAQGEIKAVGTTGQLVVDHNLTLVAGVIDTAAAASASYIAGGNMTLTQVANPTTPSTTPGMGGQLKFNAASITSNAQVVAASGSVTMSGVNGVSITGGRISTAGQKMVFGNTSAYSPGGLIVLEGGNVTLASEAVLDVSAVGASAGKLSIKASKADGSGVFQLDGILKGAATAVIAGVIPSQGRFALDTDQAGDVGQFGVLNAKLNAAGFTESRQFRYRNGDVTLGDTAPGVGDNITAHQVVIAADNGNLTINDNATIDASGANGGSIELYASQTSGSGNAARITLSDNARLLAHATATTGNGGSVVFGTSSADGIAPSSVNGGNSINLLGGSINVAGSDTARNGSVTLRAPRVNSGNDVAVASLSADIQNSSATKIEAYNVYQAQTIMGTDAARNNLTGVNLATNLDPSSSGLMYTAATVFMTNQAAIRMRLGSTASIPTLANLNLNPGIEVRAATSLLNPTGNLTVSVNEFSSNAADRGWNLDSWRFGTDAAPLTLTLRAANNLNILGSISDGFVKPTNLKLGMPNWNLASGASASYRLTGGADFAAANPMAVHAGSGDVYFGFADRTPKSLVTLVDILDRFGDVIDTIAVTVPWRSTDGSLTSSSAPLVASNALVTKNDAPVALVRTGTGSINVAAGRDVTLGMAKFFVNVYSDPFIDGTPVIYDAANSNGSYQVSLFGASLYTAGRASSLIDFTAPQNVLNSHYGATTTNKNGAAFGTGGGAINIAAGGNVNGPRNLNGSWSYQNADYEEAIPFDPDFPDFPAEPAIPSTTTTLPSVVPQMVNNWLFRQGRSYLDANGNIVFEQLSNGTTLNTAWWSSYDYFNAGIATFGGGDVRVSAAGNISNLSASVATNAYMPGAMPTTLTEQGGGDLWVYAGGDIRGGSFYVQKGESTLRADASVTAGDYVPAASITMTPLNPVLALGDAGLNVTAGNSLAIETAYNPTLTEQSVYNVNSARLPGLPGLNPIYGLVNAGSSEWAVTNQSSVAIRYRETYAQFSNFSTYGTRSAVNLTAVGGDLLLTNDARTLATGNNGIQNSFKNVAGNVFTNLYVLQPADFSAAALSGDLTSANGFALMPAPRGQLDLLAAGSIHLTNGATGAIRMLDTDPGTMPNFGTPRLFASADVNALNGTATGIAAHILGGLHSGDTQQVGIVALSGDIIGDSNNATTLLLPKFAWIQAGRDIVDLGFNIQHNSVQDVTTVRSGRDFIETTTADIQSFEDPSSMKNIVTGPGRIDISAGRNVDFGNRGGLVTRGNLDNPYLPEGGAGINIVAGGAEPDYQSVVNWLSEYGSVYAVIDVSAASTQQQQNELITYVGTQRPGVLDGLSSDAALARALEEFWRLSDGQQNTFLTAHSNQWGANLGLIAYVRSTQTDQPENLRVSTAPTALAVFRSLSNAKQQPLLTSNPYVADFMALVTYVGEAERDNLLAYLRPLKPGLPAELTPIEALRAFQSLSAAQQNQFLVGHTHSYDLIAYVRAQRPDLPANLTRDQAQSAFASQSTAQQSAFLETHTDILARVGSSASAESVWGAFRLLPQAQQTQFLSAHTDVATRLDANKTQLSSVLLQADRVQLNASFFSSLVEVGKQNNLNYFDQLIANLYPAAAPGLNPAAAAQAGNINVFASQIKTEQGGAINLFAPTGSAYTGLTTGISGKTPSTQGIFTIRGGAVAALVKNDFLVNQGRVFTLGGGDITLVSQYNDISAGKGAKTASSAPPPLLTIDKDGNIKVDLSGSIAGSGVATLKTRPDLPAGNVSVQAPRGIFDAGDAGVRSSGSVLITASLVLNSANISAAGSVSSAPTTVAAPSLGSVAAPAGATQSAGETANSLSDASGESSNVLNVEVVSFGDEACKDQSDGACNDDGKKKNN